MDGEGTEPAQACAQPPHMLLPPGVRSPLLSPRSPFSFKANRTLVTYDPMNEMQIAEINSQVRRYLEGTLDEIDVRSPSTGTQCSASLRLPVLGTLSTCGHSAERGTGGQGPSVHHGLMLHEA